MAGLDRDYGGMTPMIDVVFNLLIFFVVGAGSFAADKLLATKLSATSGSVTSTATDQRSAPALIVDLALKLDPGGQPVVDMNGTTYSDRNLIKSQLGVLADASPESPINLAIAADVPLGDMIDIYDTCRAAGFETINFVTQSK
jgi:biopolymer transport protein ExbD